MYTRHTRVARARVCVCVVVIEIYNNVRPLINATGRDREREEKGTRRVCIIAEGHKRKASADILLGGVVQFSV